MVKFYLLGIVIFTLNLGLSAWTLTATSDPITDVKTIQFSQLNNKTTGIRAKVLITFTESSGRVITDLLFSENIIGDERQVTFRFDKMPPVTQVWAVWPNEHLLTTVTFGFFDQMIKSKKLIIRIKSKDEISDFEFDTSGFINAANSNKTASSLVNNLIAFIKKGDECKKAIIKDLHSKGIECVFYDTSSLILLKYDTEIESETLLSSINEITKKYCQKNQNDMLSTDVYRGWNLTEDKIGKVDNY